VHVCNEEVEELETSSTASPFVVISLHLELTNNTHRHVKWVVIWLQPEKAEVQEMLGMQPLNQPTTFPTSGRKQEKQQVAILAGGLLLRTNKTFCSAHSSAYSITPYSSLIALE